MPAPPPESEPAMVTAIGVVMAWPNAWRKISACRSREGKCEAMTLRCRPRAGGDPYAAARQCRRASDDRNPGGYGSPPARGRQRLDSCQGHLSTLHFRLRGDDNKRLGHASLLASSVV